MACRAARPMRFGQWAGRRVMIRKTENPTGRARHFPDCRLRSAGDRMAAAAGQSCSGSPYNPARRNVVRLVAPTTQLAVLGSADPRADAARASRSTRSTRVADLEHDDQHSSSMPRLANRCVRRCHATRARRDSGRQLSTCSAPGSAGPGREVRGWARREDSARGQGGGSLLVRGSSCGAARRPRRAGIADTTAGSLRDASARSITAIRVGSASPSMGVVITRDDIAPQVGHGIVAGAVPIGRRTSTGPSTVQR
jgi:hypothetical protein